MNPDPRGAAAPVQAIRISWTDPSTGEPEVRVLPLPVSVGSALDNRLVLSSGLVSARHAAITMEDIGVVVEDLGSATGVLVEGKRVRKTYVPFGAPIAIGPFSLLVYPAQSSELAASAPALQSSIGFDDLSAVPPPYLQPAGAPTPVPAQAAPQKATVMGAYYHPPATALMPASPGPAVTGAGGEPFPPACFSEALVDPAALLATGLPATGVDYGTLGGGIGSFSWVDTLLISGVRPHQIVALGTDPTPQARYRRLCLNSQIPDHERLRSNTDATPDNIWGFPGYAMREVGHEVSGFHLINATSVLWHVFGEPTLAETYTPRAADVYRSIDREAVRIGWSDIFRDGRVRAIRKTTDGRYVVAYSSHAGGERVHAFLLARYLHVATGYPALQFLPDLQKYRETTEDFRTVVNAYEAHDHVYEHLRTHGGTVLLRGRGIVASRLLQRIHEERAHNPRIGVIHLHRTPLTKGHRYGLSRRSVSHHFELQPFNWPKASFGGGLRQQLEHASPEEKKRLMTDWGGTTTADRRDWKKILDAGVREGWYRAVFGEVERVERQPDGRLLTFVRSLDGTLPPLEASFIIDATGLDAKVTASPLLRDLVERYNIGLNQVGRLPVSADFEVLAMRNGPGRVFAAGSMTLGGPYAPVDSFVGLQFAARRSVDALARERAPGVRRMGPFRSIFQWMRWVRGKAP